uniref:Methyltransf_11 domain-containing protein n=2 Tax=Caenorhabditis tropicalis TaxID=1561998 RepID=A0A1I7TPQ0_9PELO
MKKEHPEYQGKIYFSKADISSFSLKERNFDVATAFFVLQFLHSKVDVARAIENVSRSLISGGIFYGLIPNGVKGVSPPPDMGVKLGAQILKKPGSLFLDGEIVEINFYADGVVCGSSKIALHSREFYENCFKNSQFSTVEWITPHFTDHAKQALGDDFCNQCLNPPCDIMFKCTKSSFI